MKKVLVITYYWPPSGGAGVQRWLKFVKYLSLNNFSPFVLTVDEQKATYPLRDMTLADEIPSRTTVVKTNTVEPYTLYKRFSSKKEVPAGGFANEGKVGYFQKLSRFLRGNLFLPDPRKGWNKFAIKKAKQIILSEKIKVIITTGPPHSTHLIGMRLQKELGVKWIADFRDPWTDIYYYDEFYHLPFIKGIDKRLEKKVLQQADKIIVVSNSIKKLFANKLDSKAAKKIEIITNGFDSDDFNSLPKKLTNDFIITYVGTMAVSYQIFVFIDALAEFIFSNPDISIQIRFVGQIDGSIIDYFKVKNIFSNVEMLGYVDHKTALSYLQMSTVLLLAIPKFIENKGILTGKLFEYLASNKLIIGIGPPDGDAAEIIGECLAGKMLDYNDKEGILDYLKYLLSQWEKNKNLDLKNTKYTKYSRLMLTMTLIDIIDQLENEESSINED